VIGTPVGHSLSPALHNAAFAEAGLDWAFVAFEVPAGKAAAAIEGARALGVAGMSVTMPHKAEAAAAVDTLSAEAARLGAVNTVVRRGGELLGESTDGQGFLDSLRLDAGFEPAGRACAVIGAGGAGRAVASALGSAGASEVVVLNRTAERARTAAALAGASGRVGEPPDVRGAELVVNATSVGMEGAPGSPPGGLPVDPALLRPGQLVVDVVYHPASTPLLEAAGRAGASTLGGVGMLVRQAALAFSLWTGTDAPVGAMWRAAEAALGAS
jgi:shikimate dehydrogenase